MLKSIFDNYTMKSKDKSGHRQRLRQRFLKGDGQAHSDEALLELLLTYAIPQKDVQPLAKRLLTKFNSLSAILEAPFELLVQEEGIKQNSATLIKLVDRIRRRRASAASKGNTGSSDQLNLIKDAIDDLSSDNTEGAVEPSHSVFKRSDVPQQKLTLFSITTLSESFEMLPELPDTEDKEKIKDYLRRNLHYSSQRTRQDYAAYLVKRMFPLKFADKALRQFAKHFAGDQELRDVCLYRFSLFYPLMIDTILDVLLPSISRGMVPRSDVADYLVSRFGQDNKNVKKCAPATISALTDTGMATADSKKIRFQYREVKLPSFAFILHSEFSDPGMYDFSSMENNRFIKAMLWKPDGLVPALYDMRNEGLLSKVSEIDSIRQFSTKYTLEAVVNKLAGQKVAV